MDFSHCPKCYHVTVSSPQHLLWNKKRTRKNQNKPGEPQRWGPLQPPAMHISPYPGLAHILGYQTGPHLYWGLGLGLVLLFCFQSPLHKEICCLVIPRCVKGFGGISTPGLFSSHRVNAASSGLSTHMCKAFSEWSYCLAEASHVAGH